MKDHPPKQWYHALSSYASSQIMHSQLLMKARFRNRLSENHPYPTTNNHKSSMHVEIKEKSNKTGWIGSGFSLANMILGAGALAMPEAFAKGGILAGIGILLLMSVAGHFTSILLVKCAIHAGVDSYEKLTEKILGAPGYLILCGLCIIVNVGAAMTYILFIQEITDMDNLQLILLCAITMLPLCIMKDWESLAILSKIKTFVFAAVTLVIVLRAAFDEKIQNHIGTKSMNEFIRDGKTWFNFSGALDSFGTFAFAVLFADTIFPIRQGMRDQSLMEWNKTSKFTVLLVFIMNITLGIGAFLNFRRYDLSKNLFERKNGEFVLWTDDAWSHGASWMLVGLMVMTVPMCIHVAREYVQAVIEKIMELIHDVPNSTDEDAMRNEIERGQQVTDQLDETVINMQPTAGDKIYPEFEGETESTTQKQEEKGDNIFIRLMMKFKMTALEYFITIFVFTTSMAMSILLKGEGGITKVMDVVGDVGCTGMAFLLPPVIFWRTFRGEKVTAFSIISAVLVLLLGIGIWVEMVAKWVK